MPRAELTLQIPDGVWIGDVTRTHPDVRVRILAALTDDGIGVGLAEVNGPDLERVLADIGESDDVTALEELQRTPEEALIQFETTTPLLLLPVQDSGVPLEMPFFLQDGTAEWEVTAPHDRLSALTEQLDAFDIPYTVDVLRQHIEHEPLLTDAQRQLVDAAVEAGYYDTPRTCTLTDLAEQLDMAKSTCSETLHRAEEQIIMEFIDSPARGFDTTGR